MEIDPSKPITNKIAAQMSKGCYPPIFHIYRRKGIYAFRIFKNMTWRYVIIGL
jgi:hypothetical protein